MVISRDAFITTRSHDLCHTMEPITQPIRIGAGVRLTSPCIVQMGTEIGDNAVITPGSVVHRSLPGGAINGGNPAVYAAPSIVMTFLIVTYI
jgi:putative colanic acid biosynthesis acetyltransferase WcaF